MIEPMRRRAQALGLLIAVLAPRSSLAQESPDPRRFEEDIQAFEDMDPRFPPPVRPVLFVGSSSIVRWDSLEEDFAGTPVLNRGFGGSHASDLLHHLDRVVLPYEPRMVFVYEGDNDLNAGKTPQRILADYRELVARIHSRLPDTRIAFISVKPSPSRRHLLPLARETNRLLEELASGDVRLEYVDVFTPMLDSTGEPRPELFVEDRLHLSDEGYRVWKEAIRPYVPGLDSARAPGARPCRGAPASPVSKQP